MRLRAGRKALKLAVSALIAAVYEGTAGRPGKRTHHECVAADTGNTGSARRLPNTPRHHTIFRPRYAAGLNACRSP